MVLSGPPPLVVVLYGLSPVWFDSAPVDHHLESMVESDQVLFGLVPVDPFHVPSMDLVDLCH